VLRRYGGVHRVTGFVVVLELGKVAQFLAELGFSPASRNASAPLAPYSSPQRRMVALRMSLFFSATCATMSPIPDFSPL